MEPTLRNLTLKSFHEGLLKKSFSALEITQAIFRHAKEDNKKIGAYLSLSEEDALQRAEETDIAIAKDEKIGNISGSAIAVKDNILIKGQSATAASKILEKHIASYDAGVIARLKKEKAVFIGKTNMDEFAMGSSTENSAFGPTRNPYNLELVPGGSSGGSAAAVAAHLALAALGSDTGGSIRQPAAFCGVVGLKPTYGAVSRSGLISMASSLDQIGPLTKTVEDAAILFRAIAGNDPFDATSKPKNSVGAEQAPTEYGEELTNPDFEKIKKMRVGVPDEYFADGLDAKIQNGVEKAMDKIKSLGLKFEKISLPRTKHALSCYYIIMPAEISSNLARFDGIRYSRIIDPKIKIGNLNDIYLKQRGEGFGTEAKRRIILGTFILSSGYYDAYYEKAQRVRTLITQDFDEAFKKVDVILSPVTPTPPFKIGEKTTDPLAMYLSDIFTIPANLAGLPAISIPVEPTGKPPIGFQLIGKRWREADILGIGQFYDKLNQ